MNKFFTLFAVLLISGSLMADAQLFLDSVVISTDRGPSEKEVYLYDASGTSTRYNVYNYNSGTWALTKEYQLEHIYSAGKLQMTNQKLNTGSGWILMSRVDYAYDAAGRLSTETRYSRSAAGNTWNEMSRDTYHYDSNGQVDTLYHEMWESGAWEPYMTMVTTAESSEQIRVMDRYWTGYEEEGADGQMIFYYSEKSVSALQEVENANNCLKRIENGHLLILRNGLLYDAVGRPVSTIGN